MKQRFSSLDVRVISRELSQALVGLRISNIYDLSSRIYLFKLAKPDTRKQLIVDTGFRCHLTEYSRTTAAAPSPFIVRLRKFLKTRRVTAVTQVGTDRIIDIELSDGNFHVLLEFYAGGNIILTDKEYKIIALHRIVPEGSDQEEVKVGLQYVLTNKQNYNGVPPLSIERLREALEQAKDVTGSGAEAGNNKRAKKKQAEALRRAVSLGFPEYPPLLLEHAFHITGFDTNLKPEQVLGNNELVEKLMLALVEAENVNSNLSSADDTPGYIVSKTENKAGEDNDVTAADSSKPKNLQYVDFHPFKPRQFENEPGMAILKFDTFNKAVDEYFSSVESQKLESRLTEREEMAKRKLEAAQKDQEKRVGVLKDAQELHVRKAQAIEANLLRVEEAMNAVNGLIAQGMDWVEIARLIEMEKGRQNPVAKVIKLPLKLYENTVTLLLGEPTEDEEPMDESDEEDEDEESSEDEESKRKLGGLKKPEQQPQQQLLSIDIDLGISPWANARQYYEQKKAAAVKEEKTLMSTKKAIKSTEKKVTADLKQALKQEKPVLRPARTPFWFEKFIFFVSSDGYLVLGGRDVQQTEILYRRHLKKGDVYVHADVEGAIPFFVKNKPDTPDAPIPPGTLSQAGNLCVATSSAWDSKAVMGAWWVNEDQVSKTTPSGEYLATGGFVIRGEKNQLPPAQLLLGFAVMFQISSESIKNHTKHRVQDEASITHGGKETQGVEELPIRQDQQTPRESESKATNHQPEQYDSSDQENGEIEENTDDKRTNPLLHEDADSNDSGSDDRESNIGEDKPQDVDAKDERENNHAESKAMKVAALGGNEISPKEEKTGSEPHTDSVAARPAKHPSAREKRQLKKGVPIEQVSARPTDPESRFTTNEPSRSSTPSVAASTATTNIRGKRGKNKKITTKYQHQDEEDRELALRLLGSAPQPDKLREAVKSKADRQAELEAQKQRRRAQHDRAAQAERERQKTLQQQAETQAGGDDADGGDAQLDDADTAADLSCLPSLVGTAVAGDEIVAAIPVCAPWMALGQYKYRAKLQPGTLKKGKAVKEIYGKWVVDATAAVNAMERGKGRRKEKDEGEAEVVEDNVNNEREDGEDGKGEDGTTHGLNQLARMELELIKGWREAEIMNTLPVSRVKIVSGGSGGGDKGGKGKGAKTGGGGGKGGKGGKSRGK